MAVLVTIRATDDAMPSGGTLEDVLVRVYSASGDVFVTEGDTDEDGGVSFLLDDLTTYWVRFFLTGYAFDPRLLIEVDDSASSNTFTAEGRDLTALPPSGVAELCRASGEIVNPFGAPAPSITFVFSLTYPPRPLLVGNRYVAPVSAYARSDAEGYFEVDLIRNGLYDVSVEGREDEVWRVKVPDYPAVNVNDLVWPYLAVLEFDEDSLALSAGDEVEVDLTATLSSRVGLPYEREDGTSVLPTDFLEFTSSNETVATVKYDVDAEMLVVTALAAGTATVSASVREGAEPSRQPEPSRSLGSITVTVT